MAELFHPIALAENVGSGVYGAGADVADFIRRYSYDPIVHNQVRLMRQGRIPAYNAALLAKILAPGSTYENRRFDPISPVQNANFVALLKHMGYLQNQAL